MRKENLFTRIPSYKDFRFEKTLIEGRCVQSGINPLIVSKNLSKQFVLIHRYLETGFNSIVAFSNSPLQLRSIYLSHPRYGSSRHLFEIYLNHENELVFGVPLPVVKDICLINICKNVAEYLSLGEYAMLKKSYYKSQAWFDKAKNSASLGADILNNY